ncbi:MAG: hypothetical protein KJ583_03110 [Nanoarchaeota archaeon]|nr:hypothetical protein [Nanoarchaeota archaeon]MBU1269812.1 hypothetical protein [Nanoarchaeota archaeon]MBU1604283.1 hypothetical protein [Nanoarchaeota archaeon]MBU2442443.1 hypothetical protein [Nanoarchaeota archaeon]
MTLADKVINLEKEKEWFENQEKERIDALHKRDSINYFKMCNELGVDPEDKDLYKSGFEWQEFYKQKEDQTARTNEKTSKEERIENFLKESKNIPINNFSRYADEKAGLLAKYFPGRFGPSGKQDITKYEGAQVGAIFSKIVKNYNK